MGTLRSLVYDLFVETGVAQRFREGAGDVVAAAAVFSADGNDHGNASFVSLV